MSEKFIRSLFSWYQKSQKCFHGLDIENSEAICQVFSKKYDWGRREDNEIVGLKID